MLRIEVEQSGGNVCLRCYGALLVGAELERLPELARRIRGKGLVLDLKRVSRIDAHGVGVIAAMARTIREHGSELKLVHVPKSVRGVFETCGLDALLDANAGARSSAA